MGRVSDAMWRAGRQESTPAEPGAGETGVFSGDETEFVSGEDTEEKESAPYSFDSSEPRIDPPEPRTRPPFAPPARLVPIDRGRVGAGPDQDVRIVDVLGTLFRHRWLMVFVVAMGAAAAAAYNYTAVPIFEARA